MRCDTCNSKDLKKIYRSESTNRDLNLFICNQCSLLQSFPKRSGVYPKTVSVTSGAAWGYIRYGKEQRLKDAIKFIKENLGQKIDSFDNILDIGSNRGHFLEFACDFFKSSSKLIGIEPHTEAYEDSCNRLFSLSQAFNKEAVNSREYINKKSQNINFKGKLINVINKKIEDLEDNIGSDFIYCSHTLEHVLSPKKVLEKVANQIINNDAYIYIEVPNIKYIECDQPTEFFIDNHLHHFSEETLCDLIKRTGLSVINIESTFSVIKVLASKTETNTNRKNKDFKDNRLYNNAINQVEKYKLNLLNWSKRIKNVESEILLSKAKKESVYCWGAARTLHYLISNSEIKYSDFDGIYDTYLSKKPEAVLKNLDFQVFDPKELLKDLKDNSKIFVASFEYIDEILKEIRKVSQNVKVITIYGEK